MHCMFKVQLRENTMTERYIKIKNKTAKWKALYQKILSQKFCHHQHLNGTN